jgi:hypothetical protein
MSPIWLTDNMLSSIRYFDRWIAIQGQEACFLMFKKWVGPIISSSPSSYSYNSAYQRYEFELYKPTVPVSNGKPLLSSLQMFLDGNIMNAVYQYDQTTSNLDYWVETDSGGPKNPDIAGTIIIGFHTGLDPGTHVISYTYERVCHCIDVYGSFQPISTCSTCFGSGYVGGYDQYLCPALIEGGRIIKPTNTILCRFPITSEYAQVSKQGLVVQTQRKSWSIVSPLMRDWDILIRLRSSGSPYNINPVTLTVPNERYFITDWEHSSIRPSYDLPLKAQPNMSAVDKGITLHQKFNISEIQPQHIAYTVPFSID